MNISDLNKMEAVVSENNNLFWDGWTVVERTPVKDASMNPAGVFVNGKWFTQKRFVPSRNGWKIPSKYVR